MLFPEGFVWGAAAAAYQIEGAATADGRGPSVWDAFCRRPGAVWNGQSGDTACDHYHHYREDVALMAEIGLQAYRLSVSWPRVLPAGDGAVNPRGLDFYDRLVDTLLAAGITPYITLFHWDFPYELYYRGGWLNRDSADWFAHYAGLVVARLGDRVAHWITLNEPQVFVMCGHRNGDHAPGLKLPMPELLRVGHHALLAHGKAVQAVRAHSPRPCQIGYAPCGVIRTPETESAADIDAARQATFSTPKDELWNSAWWMDPVYLGHYPEEGLRHYDALLPAGYQDDMATIHQPLDFQGFNTYSASRVRADGQGGWQDAEMPVGYPSTAFRWWVTPDALYWAPKFFHERYVKPVYVTENGLSNIDWVSLDGKVHDPQRIDFLTRYLRALGRAAAEGVDIHGYFQWSILDNFEWAEGYKERFGLVYVDYPTQRRIRKDSAYWYGEVIRTNGACLATGTEAPVC